MSMWYFHELAVKRKDNSLMNEYRKLRNTVTDMIKNRKREYFTDVSNSSRTNPRSFWAELGSIIPKINIKSIPRNMSAEEFNIYFKNVPDLISSSFTGESSLLWKGQESIYTFKFKDVQRTDLMTLLISLSDKTGMDILGFDRKLVKIAGEHIVDSLLCIINDSLSNGTFPDDWKIARVTPVYKNNGDINVMSNYRPISVIGHIAKMVEQLVRSQLVSYLEEHAFISTDQSAYLKGHSTQTSLHRVIDDWLENINDNQTTGVCLLDISKCFDTISHRILLQKLSMYGIKHTELEWFSSYLDKRKQAVFCHNKLSSLVDLTTGVPQGSVLGPFLFLLFINDISNFTTDGCVTNLFADDAMIYASGDSVSEVQRKLQSCLSNISSWYRENRLKINNDKSKVMLVGSKAQLKSLNVDEFILNYEGMPLELVENAKYLGMTINSDISWDFHVQRLCQNMYYHLSLLRRLRRIFPNNLLLQVYKSYVQPRLDYGITLYGCSTQKNIDLIQRVQNHAARLITGNFDYINCRGIELVKSLNLYTIRDRRDYFLTILMFKSIHGIAPTYLSDRVVMNFDVNGYDTRTSDMELYLPTLRKEAYRNSFMYMGGKLWNDLPEFVQNSANIESFKRNYKMSKLLMNSWLIQQFLRLFLRFVRFCVMKWLFLTFWAVRSIPWCGWIFVSHIAYTILNYVSVSSNLVLRF